MNKGILIAGIIIFVLVGGGLFAANQQSQKTEKTIMTQEKAAMAEKETIKAKEDAAMKENEAMTEKGVGKDAMMKKEASRYIEYSKAALDQATIGRRVLYFYASWCPICRPADANFKENTRKIPEDVTVVRVNYSDPDTDQEEKDLAQKYGITYQHTFVQIDAVGKEVSKWNGGQINELLENIK